MAVLVIYKLHRLNQATYASLDLNLYLTFGCQDLLLSRLAPNLTCNALNAGIEAKKKDYFEYNLISRT